MWHTLEGKASSQVKARCKRVTDGHVVFAQLLQQLAAAQQMAGAGQGGLLDESQPGFQV